MTSVEQLTQSDIEDSFAGGSAVKRGWTLFVACAGVALVIASMVALNTALADVAVATAATQSQLTWIVDSYTLLLACLLLPAGAIGDRYGRRSALLVGLAIFAVASFAPLIFDSPVQIIAARALAGVGAAFVMPATLSLLTVVYPAEARTKAVGIGGSLLAIAFGIIEIRRHEPLLDVRLFLDPYFGTSAAAITLVFLGTFALFYLTTQFIQQVMGYSPLAAAIALAPLAIPLLTFSALSSWYLPKFGLRAVIFASMVLVAVGFLCMRTLSPDASYLDLFWPLMVISSGFGLATAPTTSAIMSAAPDGKQGVASAVNDATREVGGALGIAIAGSILASSYGHHIASGLDAFPQPVRGPVSDSLAEALAVAHRLGPQGQQLADVSKAAFDTAIDSSFLLMAVIVGIAAVVVPFFAPGRDGEQFAPVRRLRCYLTRTPSPR